VAIDAPRRRTDQGDAAFAACTLSGLAAAQAGGIPVVCEDVKKTRRSGGMQWQLHSP
jgi:hypothetical protein